MRIIRWLVIVALLCLYGCCSQPGVFQKAAGSLEAVQSFYDTLVQDMDRNEQWRLAVVAADTTLLLAGELQEKWCVEPQQARQLELQTRQAQELAKQAGIAAPGAAGAAGN